VTFFHVGNSDDNFDIGVRTYSGGQNKVGQCFFANVNLLALSMVTMKIFIYLL
jgi:hypothetical protein